MCMCMLISYTSLSPLHKILKSIYREVVTCYVYMQQHIIDDGISYITGDSDSKDDESGYESNRSRNGTVSIRNCTKSADHRKSFTKLKLKKGSHELLQFEHSLMEESEGMSVAFADLLDDTFRNLKKTVPFEDVRWHSKRLVETGNYNDSIFCCSSLTALSIRDTEDYEQLEDVLVKNYCSWFNYNIIKEIRKKYLFQNSDLDRALHKYEEKFADYCEHRCYEVSKPFNPKPVANMKSLIFKMDKKFADCTLEQIHKISYRVAGVLNCPEYAIYVKSVKEGCVRVSCYILPHVAVSQLNREQMEQLKQNDIFSFKIEGVELMKV